MARVQILQPLSGLGTFDGASVTQSTATACTVTLASGATITFSGAGFVQDGAGLPLAGTVSSMTLQMAGTTYATYAQMSVSLVDLFHYGLGLVSGAPAGGRDEAMLGQLILSFDDTILGGVQADRLMGLDGNDRIETGDGDDLAMGGAGDDTLLGGAGDDWLAGGAGVDRLDGGSGRDIVAFAEAAHGIVVDLSRLRGQVRDDGFGHVETLLGVEVIHGSDFGDVMTGGTLGDSLFGNGGSDVLEGGAGHDVLGGGSGNDVLRGGAGNDTLLAGLGEDGVTGGSGADLFSFLTGQRRIQGAMTVADFAAGVDHFELEDAWGGIGAARLTPRPSSPGRG